MYGLHLCAHSLIFLYFLESFFIFFSQGYTSVPLFCDMEEEAEKGQ